MKHHELKTDPAVFAAVIAGIKTHEIRFDDRAFAVGDVLHLRETRFTGYEMRAGEPLEYTGRSALREVSHIQTGYGLAEGWVILSFHTGAPVTGRRVDDARPASPLEWGDVPAGLHPVVRYTAGGEGVRSWHRLDLISFGPISDQLKDGDLLYRLPIVPAKTGTVDPA